MDDLHRATSQRAGLLGSLAMAACTVLLWPVLRPYQWVNGDAQLYAVQAIARAHPDRFANDLYFLFGSQDRFTLLTAAAAPVFEWLGVDHACALLTVIASVAWAISCFALARATSGTKLAWISLVFVIAQPGWYGGGGQVFCYGEGFFSARLPAEALAMAALALQLRGQLRWGLAALALALVVHPLMATPAAGVFLLLAVPQRRWWLVAVILGAMLGASLAIASHAPFGRVAIIDPTWYGVIERRSWFLFPSHWHQGDWLRVMAACATLTIGVKLLGTGPAGRLAGASLMVVLLGLLAASIAGDAIPVILFAQAQVWRAQWIATLVAALLVPAMVAAAWRLRPIDRAAALLLASAWLDLESVVAVPLLLVAAILAWYPRDAPSRSARLVLIGSSVAAAIPVVFGLLGAFDAAHLARLGAPQDYPLEQLRNVGKFAAVALLFAGTIWSLSVLRPARAGAVVAAAVVLAMAIAVVPAAIRQLISQEYSGPTYDDFADWRARIPQGANVLWLESPSAVWFLLERPHFVSIHQLAGVVFSRELAMEGAARAERIRPVADPAIVFEGSSWSQRHTQSMTLASLHDVCQDPRLGFVVSDDVLPGAVGVKHWPDRSHPVYLYDCQPQHSPSAGPS